MSPAYMRFSLVTGIWVQSSVIAVLTVFCAFTSIISFLAEELDERTNHKAFSVEIDALSHKLDEWLNQFHQVHVMVENLKEYFSLILTLFAFYAFIHSPHHICAMMLDIYVEDDGNGSLINLSFDFYNKLLFTLMLCVRLGTIVTVCHQLEDSVIVFTLTK